MEHYQACGNRQEECSYEEEGFRSKEKDPIGISSESEEISHEPWQINCSEGAARNDVQRRDLTSTMN